MTNRYAGNVLIVDDNLDVLTATRLLLKKHYTGVICCDDPSQVCKLISQNDIDLVLLDMNFRQDSISGQEGFSILHEVTETFPEVVVVMMTAYADIQLAISAIQAGAINFIAKPWQNAELLGMVASAFKHVETRQQVTQLNRRNTALNQLNQGSDAPIIGRSGTMKTILATVEKAAKTNANVLILGESGTGKELIARAIHLSSQRADEAFVNLDMGAISTELFESELFGHRKGAFTNANRDRVGRFELADKGTLFLDELGNLPLQEQAKLLSALQNREIMPVGANKTIQIDIRLIAATNSDLHHAVNVGEFRQDLLYRLNTIEITLPPLRERKQDIPLLVEHYLQHYNTKYKRFLEVSDRDIDNLCEYKWPGNVRELAHSIERAVILSEGKYLDIASVLNNSTKLSTQPKSAEETVAEFNLETVENQTILSALTFFQGNVSKTSKALGITRGALYRRLEKYGIKQ
ncbi:sigma-54-dependent transcriptional regulator [Brumicola nitratireducens]|nr:sigma-54 dependent transcriptional regulator [Glaciecola nitratireducens]